MMRRLTRPWVLVFVLTTVIALSGGYAIATYFQRATSAEAGEQRAQETTASIAGPASSLSADVKAACDSDEAGALTDLGINCGAADQTQDAIDEAPAQVVQGPTGPVGPAGPAVAIGQIRSAVAAFCSANDDCVGPAGRDGTDGEDSTVAGPRGATGDASTVPGPRGPAGESVKGDPGTNGTNGTDGRDAPVITSSSCNEDNQIVLAFDNDTSIVVADSACRVSLLP